MKIVKFTNKMSTLVDKWGGVKLLNAMKLSAGILAFSGTLQAQTTGYWPDNMGVNTTSKTHVNKAIGVNVQAPDGWQEIRYCPPQYNDQKGFVVTREDCNTSGATGVLSGNDNFVGYSATGDPFPNQGNSILPVSFNNVVTLGPIPFAYYNMLGTAPSLKLNPSADQPMILARTVDFPNPNRSGSYKSRFIVMPNGKSGFNTESPRAALDVQSTNVKNAAVAMFGNILPFSLAGAPVFTPVGGGPPIQQTYTRGLSIVPNLKQSGYNSISKDADIGIFFTDAQGGEGSNSTTGAFVIAPFTKDSTKGGLRMEANGNTELRGNLRCTKVTVNAKWWPDFVFEPSYKLATLSEVSSYIQKNKHLPGMPSQAMVVTNGQDVGELQQLQQQKIEELTLYAIEQDKKIAEQEARLQKLEQLLLNK